MSVKRNVSNASDTNLDNVSSYAGSTGVHVPACHEDRGSSGCYETARKEAQLAKLDSGDRNQYDTFGDEEGYHSSEDDLVVVAEHVYCGHVVGLEQ